MKRPLSDGSHAPLVLGILGFLFSVLPPAAATLLYFPLWHSEGRGSSFSGICALFLCLSALPIYRYLKRKLSSPAAYTVWLILFLAFFFFSRVAEEMTVIAFTGFIGNLIGAVFFRIGKKERDEK